MTRRSFITSTLQTLALISAVKLGLGNMTSEDVNVQKLNDFVNQIPANAKLVAYSPSDLQVRGWSIDGKSWHYTDTGIVSGDLISTAESYARY